MQQNPDGLAELLARAKTLQRAARSCLAVIGAEDLPTRLDLSDPHEPSVWLRNDVLIAFGPDCIVVSRISANMTDVEELGRFPAEAVLDAAKFCAVETIRRLVERQVEISVMAGSGASPREGLS